MAEITLAVAALAGLGSFVAPCILPMIPAFLAYISGTTLSELNQKDGTKTVSVNRTNIVLNSVFFCTRILSCLFNHWCDNQQYIIFCIMGNSRRTKSNWRYNHSWIWNIPNTFNQDKQAQHGEKILSKKIKG